MIPGPTILMSVKEVVWGLPCFLPSEILLFDFFFKKNILFYSVVCVCACAGAGEEGLRCSEAEMITRVCEAENQV